MHISIIYIFLNCLLGKKRFRSGYHRSGKYTKTQKVLQFQSRGTLAAISGPLVTPGGGLACTAEIGVIVAGPTTDGAPLELRLLVLLCHDLNSSKQWLHVREGAARGLNLASSSRGIA